ncbi:class I SAM-dependent methyltransferase [Lysinibacillus endophyticus]|uniref:class I SAM-dependent methyltransferase n=1 Tax=Ureibacillus endophyticus TaxID=1978490 RepID=UPI0020A1C08E|nr:methyltransferase domain-containing protein [Lysinibacillus endophyticus]MCP1144455.1 methyltransferase [Lysinibacillus endophyticus]
MNRSPLQIDFEQLWKQGMYDWHGKMPERMINDELEEAFWTESIKKKTYRQTDAHAKPIYEKIRKHIPENATCLEIGPGWGNYTFPLREDVNQLTLVDSSESVLRYLQQYFIDDDAVRYVHAKWEESEIEPHDVVVGVNCYYRIYEMNAALLKMNHIAKKRAIIGLTTGQIQPHYVVLDQKYGYDIKYPRRDYIEIFNMLYQLGIYADCEMLPLERTYYYESYEDLYVAQSKKILNETFQLEDVKNALADFITEENGQIVYRHKFYAAIISWQPINI